MPKILSRLPAQHAWLGQTALLVWGALVLSGTGGCSRGPARLATQNFGISAVVADAMTELDANQDSVLDHDEMIKAPSLLSALAEIDKDGDGKISQEELTARIQFWRASRIAIMPANCLVIGPDGRALAGATVTFEPEPFLSGVLHEATGTTGASGMASMSVEPEYSVSPRVRGVYCGLYRVKVSLLRDGKETIDSRYNTETTLGTEVYPNQVPMHNFRLSGS